MEQRKQSFKLGTPMPDSVEEFLGLFQKNLSENPMLQEFIRREHLENHGFLELLQRQFDRRVSEQNLVVDNLKMEVADLRRDVKEIMDNFNLYAAAEQRSREQHRERVRATLERIDKELSY